MTPGTFPARGLDSPRKEPVDPLRRGGGPRAGRVLAEVDRPGQSVVDTGYAVQVGLGYTVRVSHVGRTTDLEPVKPARAGVFRLTVEQVHRMLASGILADGEPVELIEGILVRKDRGPEGDPMVISSLHALGVTQLARLDRLVEPLGYHVRVQQPVTLAQTSEPEPDVSVAAGVAADYATRHTGPADLALVVEVAESSLHFDRTTKAKLYASTGVPAYWIVNLVDRQVEVFCGPLPAKQVYERASVAKRGESIALSLGARTLEVAVSSILPADA